MLNTTKIIATIGPKTNNPQALLTLQNRGMSVARLNGSHADLTWHAAAVKLLRDTLPNVPILLDIPGRKVRTTQLKNPPSFNAGDSIVLTSDAETNDPNKVPLNYPNFHAEVSPGHRLVADDGRCSFEVIRIQGQDIHCMALNAGTLGSAKGVNVPGVRIGRELLTERDKKMVAFAKDIGVDYLGISFVESAEHVNVIKAEIGKADLRVIAKVENQGGLAHVDEIASVADVVMIDRGDLSVEADLPSLVLFQKHIIERCNRAGCPVIVATEMLHTMIENRHPTKAEISDITNAVLDKAGAVMLSGETAIGAFPFEAVEIMRDIVAATERHAKKTLHTDTGDGCAETIPHAVEEAIVLLANNLKADKIVAVTRSGYAARMLSSRHTDIPIIAVSDNPNAARAFNILPGVTGVGVDLTFSKTDTTHVMKCLEHLWCQGHIANDDLIIVTAVTYPRSGNRMNMIQSYVVGDLVEVLGWESEA